MDKPIDPGARATKFRFKRQKNKQPPDRDQEDRNKSTKRPCRRRGRNQPHTNLFTNQPLGSDAAFAESLFDALADDEGAAYWQRVYGQPIHIYGRPTKYNPDTATHEPVTDAEYAAYVRQQMWARTHAGALEEMRRRTQQHEARMAEERAREACEAEEERLRRDMEQALRRGEARRKTKEHEDKFARYTKAWEAWDGTQDGIPWPTRSGTRKGVAEKTVRSFFTNGLGARAGSDEFAAGLKEQRVRWHPDKMQQKLGGKDKVSKGVMADITMIFQVIDTLYNDFRKASK